MIGHELDVYPIASTGVLIPVVRQRKRRAQVKPVGVSLCLSCSRVWLAPEEEQRFSTHPLSRHSTQDSIAVEGVKCLEALHQTNFSQVGRALGGGWLGQIGTLLGGGHHLSIGMELCLLIRG